MSDIITPIVSFLCAIALCLVFALFGPHPHSASCPRDWWLPEGVRADGSFECRPRSPEQWERNARGGWIDASKQPGGMLRGRVYCNANERAQTLDGVTVLCR